VDSIQEMADSEEKFDVQIALRRYNGDWEALRRKLKDFLADSPGLLNDVREAVFYGYRKRLERSAYRLGWALSTLSAKGAFEAALQLEDMARKGNLSQADRVYLRLKRELDELETILWRVGRDTETTLA